MVEENIEDKKKALEEFRNENPFNAAAKIYDILMQQYDQQKYQLSKKGLLRVLDALMKVPLLEMNAKLNKLETNVYAVTSRIAECKFIMISKVLSDELHPNEEATKVPLDELNTNNVAKKRGRPKKVVNKPVDQNNEQKGEKNEQMA